MKVKEILRNIAIIFMAIMVGMIATAGMAGATINGVIQLPQTGQIKCYNTSGLEINCTGTGQDGEVRAGVAWPNPRFVDNNDGTISDMLTGLMWLQDGNCFGQQIWNNSLNKIADFNNHSDNYTCQNYSAVYTDWRLPNINELDSLLNPDQAYPSTWLNNQGFKNIQYSWYWSSTTRVDSVISAWAMSMMVGWVSNIWKGNTEIYLLPVRLGQFSSPDSTYPANVWKTGQKISYYHGDDGYIQAGVSWPVNRFMDKGDGTIIDGLTTLMWTKNAVSGTIGTCSLGSNTWQNALDYIKCLNSNKYLSYDDWQLPNKNELYSLIDFSQYNPALPLEHPFTGLGSNSVQGAWTSTTISTNPNSYGYILVWGMQIVNGGNIGIYKNGYPGYPYFVWPVRGGQRVVLMPSQPSNLTQLKSDAITTIIVGGTTNERIVKFSANVSDIDGDQVRLQVELRRIDENNGQFNESLGGLKESELVANGSIAMAAATELVNGGYHLRARTLDEHGNKSEWQDFGGNLISEADFTVSVSDSQNFKLAHMTDVHLGYYFEPIRDFGISSGMKNSVTNFTDKLQDIKGQNVEQIVVTGDLVEQNKPEFFMAFKNLVREFNVNTTPGNHDRRTLFWGNDLTNYQNIINSQPDWNFSYKGYNIIGLNSGSDYSVAPIPECDFLSLNCISNINELNKRSTPESDGLTDPQWNKLNTGGFSSENQRQLIFMHSPVMNKNNDNYDEDQISPVPLDGGPGGNNEATAHHRADLINYTINNKVDAVFSGHTHENGIFNKTGHQVSNTTSDRPLFIQTSNDGYRIVEVKDGKINPHETKVPEVKNRKSSAVSFLHSASGIDIQYGLHAYDSQNRHTGMLPCSNEFETAIPNSYYTGNYLGASSVPEVIVGYSDMDITAKVTEFRILSLICLPKGRAAAKAVSSVQSTENNIAFNQTITDQTNVSTVEIVFYNITLGENSTASVNVSDAAASYYGMQVDLENDGVVDQVIIPDSVSTVSNEPQQNISIISYDGSGLINISVSAGNITGAVSMNASTLPPSQFAEFPRGLIGFAISGLMNGSLVDVTIELPENISADSQFWEYGQTANNANSRWYRIPFGSNDGDNIIIVELEDGGAGDDDGIANGVISSIGGYGPISRPGIYGAALDSASRNGIIGVTISIDAGNSTMSDLFGFYSLPVSEGEYNLTAKLDPVYYANSTIQVSTVGVSAREQDILLVKKPTGSITGNVRN